MRKKWEHEITKGPSVDVEWLNKRGNNGWKLCGATEKRDGNIVLYWAREVSDEKEYTEEQIASQIETGRRFLVQLGIPDKQINKMTLLTFLALCSIAPDTEWKDAERKDMGLSNDIMKFVSDNYGEKYKSNTRESFRREGINVLLNHGIIDLNPSNPNLGPTSPLTHYAIKESILKQIQQI